MVSKTDRIQEILDATDDKLNRMRGPVVIRDDESRAQRRKDRFRGDDAAIDARRKKEVDPPPPSQN